MLLKVRELQTDNVSCFTPDCSLNLVLFEQARVQAEELDREFAKTKQIRGPLHGVPVSFKDTCAWNLETGTLNCYFNADHPN